MRQKKRSCIQSLLDLSSSCPFVFSSRLKLMLSSWFPHSCSGRRSSVGSTPSTSQRSWSRRWNCRKDFKVNFALFLHIYTYTHIFFFSALTVGSFFSVEFPLTVRFGLSGVGPGCTDKTLLSAIASALHTSAAPITGQLSAAVEKNPGVWLNTAQPLCKAFIVTDEDIRLAHPFCFVRLLCLSLIYLF